MTDLPLRVFVTGASRGIGRAVAQAFAARGARVAMGFSRDRPGAETTMSSLAGGGHVLVGGNLPADAASMAHEATSGLGGIDVLVNNAAVRGHHPIATTGVETWTAEWDHILGVNLRGPADLSFHVARHMIASGKGGAIVNVSSRGAWRGEPDMPAYGVSKAGLNALTRSLSLALGPHGIRVCAVAPGFVQTEGTAARLAGPEGAGIRAQSPMGRVATAEEVADAVVFLASAPMATGTIMDLNGASYLR